MSSIPTKQIDGDVAVGRNVSIGGKATVRGSATIGHNLKVEGWLDAPNIKGPNKGLFKTAMQLREAYPNPHEGWWALVGSTLPAQVYMADGGAWVGQTETDGSPRLAGNPTVDSTEYMEAVEELAGDLDAVKADVEQNQEDIRNLRSAQTTHGNQLNSLQENMGTLGKRVSTSESRLGECEEAITGLQGLGTQVGQNTSDIGELREMHAATETRIGEMETAAGTRMDELETVARQGVSDAAAAQAGVDELGEKIGAADGIAPLDSTGCVPREHLPGGVDVVGFSGFIDTVPDIPVMSYTGEGSVVFCIPGGVFMFQSATMPPRYYNNWADADRFGVLTPQGRTPAVDRLYIDMSADTQYYWKDGALVAVGSPLELGETEGTAYPGADGKRLRGDVDRATARLDGIRILPFSGVSAASSDGTAQKMPTSGVWWLPASGGGSFIFVSSGEGYTEDDYNMDGVGRGDRIFRNGSSLYRVTDGELREFGGATEGNCINVTVELPKQGTTNPYHDLASATASIYGARRMKLGLQITFATTAKSWKQYQYIGPSLEADDFLSEANWIDMAGTSAGKEPVININDLCGNPTAADFYSFESAIDALAKLEADTRVTYRKPGMVITYRVSDSEWETLQLRQKVSDFGNRAAWADFGGGARVETSGEPAQGGTDAFSTGGAYDLLPVRHEVTQEDGTVSIRFKNAGGEDVMEPVTFLASAGGGGEAGGTVVSVRFEESPLFGALGAPISTRAAIRSVTMAGASEVDNAIATLELIDRDTNLTVWSENVNRPSSASMDDFSFSLDFTPFLTQPGLRRFSLRATDEAGYSTVKFISVTAEDITVTVSGVQVLHVREDAPVTPSMTRATVDLYKFGNNQSDKGIEAVVDILVDGAWTELHRSTVTDTFTKSVTFSPSALGLRHGAYPIRISGTSLNSGVRGNTVYSALMVVDPEEDTPLVAIRYDDRTGGTVRLYESVAFDVAVYNPKGTGTIVNTRAGDTLISQLLCDNSHTYSVSKQIQGFAEGETVELYAEVEAAPYLGDFRSFGVPVTVSGSVIDAILKEGAIYSFDFSSRSNTEADHSITDGDYRIDLTGANYTTNGFASYLGQNCLRIAENVAASLNHMPFASQALEAAGMAWQCKLATSNIKDADARLLECYDPASGAGFYIKGNKAAIYCRNGNQRLEERSFRCGEPVTVSVTVEPSSIYVERSGVRYSALRMYLNGELVAHIGYIPGRGDLFNDRNITMDGTRGDLYIYYMLAYQTHYEWAQAFKNYLVKLTDTDAMVREFNAEDVLTSQTAEGTTAMRPSAAALWARGIPYVVLVADEATFDTFDSGTSTSDNFVMTVYYYDPVRPWRSFKATKCRTRRQGTTSAKRCKKNDRVYLSRASEITPLFPDYSNADALLTYALFAEKKIRVGEKTMAVDLITIKIDYSDAGGANDCGVCDMMNATYRALGDSYMTPAQRFFDGTQDIGDIHLDGLELNHSTANHPIAVFRSTSDTLQNVYFEAKGNWKEDKGEQTALGFMNTPGYNLGCINYQDGVFTEYYGLRDETLDKTEARFRADSTVDTSRLYLISQYCGNRYRFLRYADGQWKVMTGTMRQTGGRGTRTWNVSGYVLNPVTGFELLTYQELDWWRGVSSVDDMMQTGTGLISSWVQKLIDKGQLTADLVPLWTYYFECMVDNDDLAIAYATGRKVPFELYRMLRFCDSVDPDKHPATYAARARQDFYKFLNTRSKMVYYGATDYNSLYDQQAKNMQPMFFLEDGCYVENGIYFNSYAEADDCNVESTPSHMLPVRMYFNKVYDADGANGKDNDGGCTGDPECDPAKPTDEETGYANPYAGWNSILWVVLRLVQEFIVDDAGNKTDLRTVVAAMRSVEAVVDGVAMKPFSPEGAMYFFMEKRLRRWPKMVSSYDGIRKYVQYTATSDTIYFYALQGLGLTSLPDFIEKRWRIRDGYYQTGAFFSGYISARIACAADARIRVTAAKTGYFGIGNDNTAAVSESVYLEAGESHEFTNFSHQTGALLYIYQADRMSCLDLSEVSLGSSNGEVDFSVMALAESLRLGSATHSEVPTGYRAMTSAKLGNLPFLEELDIRRTGLTGVDCSGCPRLRKLDARDSAVESFSVAETSPINDIAMPGTLSDIALVGLPGLTYAGPDADSGLRVPSLGNVQRLRLETSPRLDARRMLMDILAAQEDTHLLAALRIGGMALKGDASELQEIIRRGVAGLDADGNRYARPVVNASYELTSILDGDEIARIGDSIEGITLHTAIEAFIGAIDAVNGGYFGGDPEVPAVTLDNIGGHIAYYNGETYAEYVARMAEEDKSIHQTITQ